MRRLISLPACIALVLMFGTSAALAQYQQKNLNSNQIGWALHADPLLANGWGLAYGPGSPFWVNDNTSGWSTLYDGSGKQVQAVKVVVPTAGENGPGSPTGIVFNGSQDFQLSGHPAVFIFDTLDGTISGWSPAVNFNEAVLAPLNPAPTGAVYTGLAISSNASGNFLYAADVANNKVDVYDGSFNLVMSFTDTTLPSGFAPFGIQDIGGMVYVTFANVAGGPGGFVDVFKEDGTFVKQLVKGNHLNQPWGVAMAPKDFGPLRGALLISNNTNTGTINGFNPATGKFVGQVMDTTGKPIQINQLWGIEFGGGTAADGGKNQLFFTAGPDAGVGGVFGVINLVMQ
jgi:uncharacterized protein (TIGR03118 family)